MTASSLEPEDNRTSQETEQGRGLQDLMLSAGLDLLERDGLGFGPDTIGYARVFRYLEDKYSIRVTRGSVHERIWASHADFRREVMTTAIVVTPKNTLSLPAIDLPKLFAAENAETAADRIAVYARTRGSGVTEALFNSDAASRTQALLAACCRLNDPDGSAAFRAAFRERSDSIFDTLVLAWPLLMAQLGLRPKPELGLSTEQAARICIIMSHAAARGAYLNHSAGCMDFSEPLAATSADPEDAWLPFSFISKSLLSFLFEGGSSPAASGGGMLHPLKSVDTDLIDLSEENSTRRPRHKLRELVVTAGVEMLLSDGVVLRPESLRYSEVLAYIKDTHGVTVHRSSVHGRLWESQEDYQMEVLARSVAANNQTGELLAAEYSRTMGSSGFIDGAVARRQAVLDAVRQMSRLQADFLLGAADYQRELLIKASLADRPESDRVVELKLAIQQADERKLGRYHEAFKSNLLSLGFSARPELGITDDEASQALAGLMSTIVAGSIFDEMAGAHSTSRTFEIERSDGSGVKDEWPIAGVAMMALFDQFFVGI